MSSVNGGMGNGLRAGKTVLKLLCNQSPKPSQPGHPSVGGLNEYWRWRPPLGQTSSTQQYGPATSRTAGVLT